jgi:8-amino-7-oxononanoate synthase
MDSDEASRSSLQAQFAKLLQRRRKESKLRDLKASPIGSVDFSSNDFLSLSTSAPLRAQFLQELAQGTPQLGSTGSRLLDGNSTYSEALEQDIATFHNGPAGLLANSGFDANVGIFSCLPQPGDVILYDELIHASVHDGMRLSRARKTLPFAHNSPLHLRELLAACIADDELLTDGRRSVFVAVETVYSMEGDLAPLTEFLEVMEELCPRKNAHMIVDEAHATGLYGHHGKGRVCELGLESRVFVRLHTFGKALACNGGKKPPLYSPFTVLI